MTVSSSNTRKDEMELNSKLQIISTRCGPGTVNNDIITGMKSLLKSQRLKVVASEIFLNQYLRKIYK